MFLWFNSRIITLWLPTLGRLEELNQGEYGPFVCAICTFCTLKSRVILDIVLSQSLSSSALYIRLMMLWVTQAANQPNQYTYDSSGGFLSKEWRTCCDNNTGKIEICGQMAVGPRLDKWTAWTSVISPGMWPERIWLWVLSSLLHGPLFIVFQQWLMFEIHMLLLLPEL